MLSNLASYLGYTATKTPEVEKAPADMWLRAVEEDDEWVLVESKEKEAATATLSKESEEDTEMTRVTLAASTHPSALPGSSKALSRSASLDVLNPLQESWYLTPPPSFTSEGPVHMETSPLENLLIEHPSMSVYERTTPRTEPSRKMSNSSPSNTVTSEEEKNTPVVLLPIKERLYKLPRNKVNSKTTKKQSVNSSDSDNITVPLDVEETKEIKETKIKNFVKSPRRSLNAELQSLPKKALRKRHEASLGSERISKSSGKQDDIREKDNTSAIPNIQPRRLYSEVLASKPETPTVQTSTPVSSSTTKEEEPLSANLETASEVTTITSSDHAEETAAETLEENVMSVEENDEELEENEDRDRRKVVQSQPDKQHRLHFLSRSAQKVEQRKTCDVIKKNPLIRTNKAREFNFRNKRQRRADMMQRHSGANNNRKCAKTTLY